MGFTAAWVFLSVGDSLGDSGWVSLADLIRTGDAYNHAIFTLEELEEGISDLVAIGLIDRSGTETRLTPGGQQLFRSLHRRKMGHIRRMLDLGHDWDSHSYPPRVPSSWSLDPEAYRAALGGG